MKSFLKNKTAVVLVIVVLLLLAAALVVLRPGHKLFLPLVVAIVVVGLLWIAIELWLRARKRKAQRKFDDSLAAKEGIDDRKREWGGWIAELERQGIDRYELPFYLLVGEPQSGKSVLLQNSDLHFPFGQTRLSGVGGTRGCDWWFTDEAVVLDLAGRLFTHEGGAADELEWQAFLDLLVDYRPLCPANGILLVIPCDGLLEDQREAALHKAARMQNALLSLSNKLQAQVPIYVVLTKADKVFGFAECVHRLDQAQRQQMFGWSRPGPRVDAPFQMEEVREGFEALVARARLLRSDMMASAKLPEAMPEVHRLVAFPDELRGLWPNLEAYLKTIFTDSNLVERLYFRGLYVTSGLQAGVPIAKVCATLISGHREADARALEALFTKQRAYFIRDLVRERVFGERGLVRPTSARLKRARRSAAIGYGVAALIAALAIAGAVNVAVNRQDEPPPEDKLALTVASAASARARERDSALDGGRLPELKRLLDELDQLDKAIAQPPRTAVEGMIPTRAHKLEELRDAIVDHQLVPIARRTAAANLARKLDRFGGDYDAFVAAQRLARLLLGRIDFANELELRDVCQAAESSSTLAARLEKRLAGCVGSISAGAKAPDAAGVRELAELVRACRSAFDQTLAPGTPWQAKGHLGYVLAWMGIVGQHETLGKITQSNSDGVHAAAGRFSWSLKSLGKCAPDGNKLDLSVIRNDDLEPLVRLRAEFYADYPLGEHGAGDKWKERDELEDFLAKQFPSGVRELATPPAAVARLSGDRDLNQVCDETFLPLAGASWASTANDVQAGAKLASGGAARRVFNAKLEQLWRGFDARVKSWSDLAAPTAPFTPVADPQTLPFDVAQVAAAAGLAKELNALGGAFDGFRVKLASLLAAHLRQPLASTGEPSEEDLERIGRALADVDALGGDAASAAGDMLASVLRGVQDPRLAEWRAVDANDRGRVESALREIVELRRRLERALTAPRLDRSPAHAQWLGDVDKLLSDLLQPSIKALRIDLTPANVAPDEPLPAAALALAERLEAKNIPSLESIRIPDVPYAEKDLPEACVGARAALREFISLRETRDPQTIAGLPYVRRVRDELRAYGQVSDSLATPELIARLRASLEKVGAPGGNEAGGGITLAQLSWQAFHDHALGALRRRCEKRVRDEIVAANNGLARALTARSTADLRELRNDTLLKQARDVFNKGQVLDRIRAEFELDGEKRFDLRVGDEKDPAVQRALRFAEALKPLQEFLRGDKEALEEVELTLTVEPLRGGGKSPWEGVTGPGGQPRLDYPYLDRYVKSGDNAEESKRDDLNKTLTVDWRVGRHTALVFSWSKNKVSKPSADDLPNRVNTAFAPLVIAWRGEKQPGGGWKVNALEGKWAEPAWALLRVANPKQVALPDQPPAFD